MNALLKTVLSLSVSGSLLIGILFVSKPFIRNQVSKRWQYYIWLVVIARLLLPFTPETSLTGTLFQQFEPAAAAVSPIPEYDTAQHSESPELPVSPAGEEPPAETASPMPQDVIQYRWVLWLGTALALLIRKITVYQSFEKYVHAGREEVSDPGQLDRLAQMEEQMGIIRPIELYTNRLISSPLLMGFRRPCIVLPAGGLPEEDFMYTVRHELTHYRRRDMFYKWLVQLTICLHWFNPLVWLMGHEIERACELSCDEAVIRDLDAQGRRAYGNTLLHAMEAGGKYKDSDASVTLSEGVKLLKERLEAIMNFQKKPVTLLSIVLSALLLMGATAAGASLPGKQTLRIPANLTNRTDRTGSTMGTLEFRGTTYYLVFNEAQLRAIGTGIYGLDQNYMQQADIQLSPEEWVPIGTAEHPFTGTYNGNGFEIKGLTIKDPDAKIIGLFGVAENADIYNITLRDYDIRDAGKNDVGLPIAPILAQGRENFRYYDNYAYPKESVPTNNNTGNVSADSAEAYYTAEKLPQFGTAFAALKQDAQKSFLEKIYADGDIAFFSVALQQLGTDSPLIAALAEKIYAEGNIAFFSVLCNHMNQETLASWQARAAADRNFIFQSMLFGRTGQEGEKQKLEAELDQQIAEEYKACGVTKSGKNYYYQGQLVHVFLDARPNKSVYTLDINPNGTVNVKILRDSTNQITGAAYMTEAEINELFNERFDDEDKDTGDDDNNWDWDWDWDWDWADSFGNAGTDAGQEGEKQKPEAELDQQIAEEYKACGVTKSGKNYYYQGKLVRIFLDARSNKSFYTLAINPNGTVNVKILRDSTNQITGAAYMTEKEISELFGDREDDWDLDDSLSNVGTDAGQKTDIPIALDSIKAGETVWLGTYTFAEGDKVYYDVTVETGERLDIGFAPAGSERTNKKPDPAYNMVSNSREDGKLRIKTSAILWKDPVKPGKYTLFLHASNDNLTNVTGCVKIVKAA